MDEERLNSLWHEIQKAVADSAWDAAEGLLRRFLSLAPASPVEVWDALGFSLLMQGDYAGCLQVLQPWAEHPGRSFWVHHKLGDALRGLNQLEQAEAHYRRSLLDGSNSSLTWRNLLQVLDGQDPSRAVAELQAWQQEVVPVDGSAWDGARQAALLVPGLGLALQLQRCGQADADCRRRLLEQACYSLDLERLRRLLQSAAAAPTGMSAWERNLQERLWRLRLLPLQ